MPIPQPLKAYLERAGRKFEVLAHKTVYTAYDLAATLKEKLDAIGKALLVKTDKGFVVVVVPASKRIDFKKLKKALGVKSVSLPTEEVVAKLLKGATMSAFGALHELETWVDKNLAKAKHGVVLQAGSFTDAVRMKAKDFIEMEKATVADLAESAGYKAPKAAKKKSKKVRPSRGKRGKKLAKKKAAKKKPAKRKR